VLVSVFDENPQFDLLALASVVGVRCLHLWNDKTSCFTCRHTIGLICVFSLSLLFLCYLTKRECAVGQACGFLHWPHVPPNPPTPPVPPNPPTPPSPPVPCFPPLSILIQSPDPKPTPTPSSSSSRRRGKRHSGALGLRGGRPRHRPRPRPSLP